ncbi:MAG: hypothetical protein ABI977_36560 [Acidobacteriota bacterium]
MENCYLLFGFDETCRRLIDFAAAFNRLSQSAQFVPLPFAPEDTLDFDIDKAVPEMHDRMIAGAARRLNI